MTKWECSVCGYIYDPGKGDIMKRLTLILLSTILLSVGCASTQEEQKQYQQQQQQWQQWEQEWYQRQQQQQLGIQEEQLRKLREQEPNRK